MTVIVRENVEVSVTDTEIIEPQDTDKTVNRVFSVSNGDNEIEIQAWGSNDGGQTWEDRGSKIIPPNNSDALIVGPAVYVVKLIGKTTDPSMTSIVDAALVY